MTATARSSAPLITSNTERFSAIWPDVFADVVRALRRRGVGLHAAEDAAQEAGARAFDRGVPFDDASDLRRWVLVVARRIAIDDARHVARVERLTVLDESGSQDVPEEAEGRLRLDATRRAFHRLSAVEQQAIRDDIRPASRKEAVKLAVRRHRARAHLLRLVEGVAALIPVIWRRGQRTAAVVALATAPILAWTVVHRPLDPQAPPDGAYEAPKVENVTLADAVLDAPGAADQLSGNGAPPAPSAAGVRDADSAAAASPPSSTVVAELSHPSPTGGEEHATLKTEPKKPGQPIACVWQPPYVERVCGPAVDIDFPL